MGRKWAQALAWVDLETTGLFQAEGSQVIEPWRDRILEVALVVTDFDLQPLVGYQAVVALDQVGLDRLRSTPEVAQMHLANGLIKDCRGPEALTLEQIDIELDATMKDGTAFEPGEFMIAGSGVAQFDLPLVRALLPKFARWLVYYPFDIGIERRVSKILAGRDIVNRTPASYGDAKLHRAYADVQGHLEEARKLRTWYRTETS